MHYSGTPVKVVLSPEHSTLVADGKTPSVIAVRLTDKDGFPAREGVVGDFAVDPSYAAGDRRETVANIVEAEEQDKRPHFQVGADGVALIPLEPTRPVRVIIPTFLILQPFYPLGPPSGFLSALRRSLPTRSWSKF